MLQYKNKKNKKNNDQPNATNSNGPGSGAGRVTTNQGGQAGRYSNPVIHVSVPYQPWLCLHLHAPQTLIMTHTKGYFKSIQPLLCLHLHAPQTLIMTHTNRKGYFKSISNIFLTNKKGLTNQGGRAGTVTL